MSDLLHIQLKHGIGYKQYLYNFVFIWFRSSVVYVLNATTTEWEVEVYPNQDRRTAEAAKEFGVSVKQMLD